MWLNNDDFTHENRLFVLSFCLLGYSNLPFPKQGSYYNENVKSFSHWWNLQTQTSGILQVARNMSCLYCCIIILEILVYLICLQKHHQLKGKKLCFYEGYIFVPDINNPVNRTTLLEEDSRLRTPHHGVYLYNSILPLWIKRL